MSDKIQMTEEQAKELWDKCTYGMSWGYFKDSLTEHGYIIKSAVEEAEEVYIKLKSRGQTDKNHDRLYEAIQELKNAPRAD
jgi:hypothetical protein